MPLNEEQQNFIYECCKKYDVPFDLMMAVFGVETGWNWEYGISPNGLYCGMGMLNIEYCRSYVLEKIGVDILTNAGAVEGSCFILSEKLMLFDREEVKALMAYNSGNAGARSMIAKGKKENSYTKFVMMIKGGLKIERERKN